MDQAPEQQPRIPGVRYKQVERHRLETTVIDGVPSTRRVAYRVWEPQPPREWDELILRGITTVTVGFTVIAVVATTASVGGLLSAMVPAPIAYGMGVVFTLSWVACLGIEWLNRINPPRARAARNAGWAALLLSMAAVFLYGYTLHVPQAGIVGACIDMLAKGSWFLLLRHHAVPLDEGVAHWVSDQEQQLAGRELLGMRLLRLNRRAAYQRAVGGPEFQAATAILAAAQTAQVELPGQGLDTTSAADTGAPDMSGQGAQTTPIAGGSIAATIRQLLADDPDTTVEDATAHVRAVHGDRPNLPDTVRRSYAREVDKLKKRTAP